MHCKALVASLDGRLILQGFVFSVKAPRYITHMQRLRDISKALAKFYASGLLLLKEKLGETLWRFPPSMRFDPPLFEDFLGQLPHTGQQALNLACHCTSPFQLPGY